MHTLSPHFPCTLFLFLLLTLTSSLPSPLPPQFPCAPPHHDSYPFCNTSLSVSSRARALVEELTLKEKIGQLIDNATGVDRLGIPGFQWWSESLHGIADNGPGVSFHGAIASATVFPQVILTASSFNRTLWRTVAHAIAVEGRAMYNLGQAGLTFWAPNINIFRDPRWGRGQETPGEDPMVASAYSIEFVKGFQGENPGVGGRERDGFEERRVLTEDIEKAEGDGLMLSACCKHYTAYDMEKWGGYTRYDFNAVVTEQDMEDTYQPPFKSCIQQGKASCLMCSYNSIDGVPGCARKDLLTKAREEWGFKGYIVSDCDAVATIYEYHNYSKSPEEAVALSLKAGMDINCGNYLKRYTQSAIDQGLVDEEDVDRALFNLFSVQIRLGFFDGNPKNKNFGHLGPQDVCSTEHRKLALEAAKQGIVLLKNDKKFLPLKRNKISSLAIIGPMANTTKLGGGYTGVPCKPKSILDEFQEHVKKIYYSPGCVDGVPCNSNVGMDDAIYVAKQAEVVIIVAGIDLSQENEELDRYSLLLPGHQSDLITSVASAAGKPIVLVLTGGGPIDVKFADSDPNIASIIWIGYPGEVGGKALAEVIFGNNNPGGRLPITWYPESFTSIPMTDMNMRADPSRAYPGRTYRFYTGDRVYGFGHGLSYTDFTYKLSSAPNKLSLLATQEKAALQIAKELNYIHVDEVRYCESLVFSSKVTVTNNGELDGAHVVMLFSRVPKNLKGAPEKQLIGFDRVDTIAYGSNEINMVIDPCKHFSVADQKGKRVLPLGDHALLLGDIEHVISVEI